MKECGMKAVYHTTTRINAQIKDTADEGVVEEQCL